MNTLKCYTIDTLNQTCQIPNIKIGRFFNHWIKAHVPILDKGTCALWGALMNNNDNNNNKFNAILQGK